MIQLQPTLSYICQISTRGFDHEMRNFQLPKTSQTLARICRFPKHNRMILQPIPYHPMTHLATINVYNLTRRRCLKLVTGVCDMYTSDFTLIR